MPARTDFPATLTPLLRRATLPAILAASVGARWALALAGGQYYFGDEERYDRGIRLYLSLLHGDGNGVREQLAMPEHAAFAWIGAAVTAVQHLLAKLGPYGDWSQGFVVTFTIGLGACILSLFSCLNIFLVHRLARTAGAPENEALWSAGLMAVSNTSLYYSRHLLPYDAALSAALTGILLGLRAEHRGRLLLAGFLVGIAYHIYNGYWFLVPLLAALIVLGPGAAVARSRRAVAVSAGIFLGLGMPLAVGLAAGGMDYFHVMMAFSRTVTQGRFSEGWSLPWAYLARSEDYAGIAVASLIAAVVARRLRRRSPIEPHVKLWLSGVLGAYALLVLFSVGLEIFVVYARTAKALVPLLALLGGWAVADLLANRRALAVPVALTLALFAGLHFAEHLGRVFPRDVEIAVLKKFGNPKHTLSVSGSLYRPLGQPVTRPDLALVNAQMLYPVRGALPYPDGHTLLKITNPLSYVPFQYESHTPAQREFLRTHDISIQLIQLTNPLSVPNDLPFPFRYQNSDRPTGR